MHHLLLLLALSACRPPCPEPACPADSGRACPTDTGEPCAPCDTGDTPDTAPPPRVAIYDDTAGPFASAWAPGLDAMEAAVLAAGYEPTRIGRDDLNDTPGLLHGFDALLFGGGYAYPGYTVHISAAGKARIQEFVAAGGAFVGICAGAYFACDSLAYEGAEFGDESGYDLDLYPGVCGGPVSEVSSYPTWAPATLDFAGHEAYEGFAAAPFQRQLFYAGGPYFEAPPAGAEVLASYDDTGPHQGLAAVIAVPYGAGRVVLWGPHPEVLEVDEPSDVTMDARNRELYARVVGWAASK
ncbi:MAG: BPL-N domain-containing protein [Pseudomonadota bacterium]